MCNTCNSQKITINLAPKGKHLCVDCHVENLQVEKAGKAGIKSRITRYKKDIQIYFQRGISAGKALVLLMPYSDRPALLTLWIAYARYVGDTEAEKVFGELLEAVEKSEKGK